MDAYDIFKKLTKGLTFKHRVLGVKNNSQNSKPTVKKEEIEIKEEQLSDNEEDIQNHSDHSASDSEGDTDQDEKDDGGLQLLDGVKVGQKKKKKEKKEKTEDLKKKLELEEQNRFRNEHGIKTVGRHVPAALQDFSELTARYNISPALVDTVTQCGYSEPTPVQRQAIACMLEDRQILACAPTGSGKTAAFLLPILHALGAPAGGPRALVLCPTRELAHQIYREALRLSASCQLRCSVVRSIKESKVKEREATIRKSDIIVSTPNRLCYLLNQDNVNISLDKVKWLIIDEADKLFEGSAEQSSDFRQQMEQILGACSSKQRRVAMFSATHTPAVAKWCRHHMKGLINVTVGQRNAATNLVDQELCFCGNENGKLVAFRQLVQQGLKPPVLVFVQSKDRAKQLFKELIYDGINVDVIHADRTQQQRDNVVRSFRVGRIWVLICTELMGRGMDFRGVNLVINYDFPPSAIAYIHRGMDFRGVNLVINYDFPPSAIAYIHRGMDFRGVNLVINYDFPPSAIAYIHRGMDFRGVNLVINYDFPPSAIAYIHRGMDFRGVNLVINYDFPPSAIAYIHRGMDFRGVNLVINYDFPPSAIAYIHRGMDFRGVNLVINYDFPPSAIAYIHRIGRAGRAGQKGRAITFFTQDDVGNLRSIASVMKQSGCQVPEYMLQLRQNPNKRKKLQTKAPSRDKISTVLEKRPDKRRLEAANKALEDDKTKSTEAIKNAKNNKQRRIQNLEQQKQKNNSIEKGKNGISKRKKKNLAKKNSNKKSVK
ncbi:hypothetical protein PYW07_004257 [Mythimna separata]|uniref:Probable ATP-dependent RNA helicase DDX52 n=1 Tax=Mythimna separata TaxID=271217 RepID=A0AAD7YYS2_MYTSE|nr:hypothetical protein PYW07_004257 [Mythimna separata]